MTKKKAKLKAPIILIGAARSGTTMLGDILSQHPDAAYWVEPKYIWKYRNPNIKNDIRSKEEVTPKIRKYIHKKFLGHQINQGKSRFIEKTPSNCFRIPFIEEIFEDAIYINIIRDGRDVTLSAHEKWTRKHDRSAYKRRLNFNELPFSDLPFYLLHFSKQIVGQYLWPGRLKSWGPITPEIKKFHQKSIEEICAFQWLNSTEYSLNHLDQLPSKRIFSIKYEDLIKEPKKNLEDILDHCKLKRSDAVLDYAVSIIKPNNTNKWRKKENTALLNRVGYILDPLLKRLDYL